MKQHYKYVPKHTYVSENKESLSSELKESKQRMTLLACANAAVIYKINCNRQNKEKISLLKYKKFSC